MSDDKATSITVELTKTDGGEVTPEDVAECRRLLAEAFEIPIEDVVVVETEDAS